MLINLDYLYNKYNINPTGVLHIGASHGEELESYLKHGLNNIIWIEAIPNVFKKLQDKIKSQPNVLAFNECISNKTGDIVKFYITNNEGQSSSMLELGIHKIVHPDVYVTEEIVLQTKTITDLVIEHNINLSNYNFLNIDIQGAELLALQGMFDELDKIKYVYLEVNTKELYKGCALLSDIDNYLTSFRFERVELKMTDCYWGDAFYIKK